MEKIEETVAEINTVETDEIAVDENGISSEEVEVTGFLEQEEAKNSSGVMSFIKKNKIAVICTAVFFVVATICIGVLMNKVPEPGKHMDVAEEYAKTYVLDRLESQYKLLDASVIYDFGEKHRNIIAGYDNKPLVPKEHECTVAQVTHANDVKLKEINHAYKMLNMHKPEAKLVEVKNAYRYSVLLQKKKTKQKVCRVEFWVVKIEGEWKICTLYEYDRYLDRCSDVDMYNHRY